MAVKLKKEEEQICRLLCIALTRKSLTEQDTRKLAECDMGQLLRIADKHKVLPLLYDVLCEESGFLDGTQRKFVENVSRTTVQLSYRMLFLTRFLVHSIEAAGIPVLVLKGCSVALWYPVPELRKSGDVDLLVAPGHLQEAARVLGQQGYRVLDKQTANHHLEFINREGVSVELHTMLAEPFQDKAVNERLDKLVPVFLENMVRREVMGVELPMLGDAHQAFQLLLHMLQHFLRSGFGLKLFCDWVVFWNGANSEKTAGQFVEIAEESGLRGFAEAVTLVCENYLGLRDNLVFGGAGMKGRKKNFAEEFLKDVFDAEEFGKAAPDRMVAVQGTGIPAYAKEFHYQMKLNHPRTSRYVVLWPALWVVTLVVFLYNNRKFHRSSASEIMRSAGRRSALVQQMELWEREDG